MAGTIDRAKMLALAEEFRRKNENMASENEALKSENADMKAALEIMEVTTDG